MAFKKGRLKRAKETWLPEVEAEAAVDGRRVLSTQAGVVIKPGSSPMHNLVGSIVLAVFWSGYFCVFERKQLGWGGGDVNWIVASFAIALTLMGLGLVGYTLLSLLNPRAVFTWSSMSVPLGGRIKLKWEFSGRVGWIRQLTIMLYAKEHVVVSRYTRDDGTARTRSEENVFFQKELVATQDDQEIRQGEIGIAIPGDSMHSFRSDSNVISWWIEVLGDIEWRPDFWDEFTIAVLPAELETA